MSLCKEREFGKVKEYTVHLDVVSDDIASAGISLEYDLVGRDGFR
jgi:hypothetical protein